MYGRAALLLLLAAFAISFSQASIPVTYEVIALGGTNPHGIKPRAGLVLGPDGNYYGTTSDGGESAGGTVFKLTPDGVLTALAAFTQTHGNPSTTPIVGFDGNLYGTTNGAPDGLPGTSTIYRVSLAGALEIIASFPNGDSPPGLNKLVQGSDGNFYGTTTRGGANGRGSVFQLTPGGTFTTLLSFAASEGIPRAGLVEGDDGNFYGTTYFGGANGAGMVFRITPAGALTPLHSFSTSAPSFGFNPVTELTKASDGSFYGVTRGGGANNVGVIFRVTAAGELTSVASVPRGDSINGDPNPVAFGEDGNLYGTTREHFYRVSPDGTVTTLVNFAQNSGGRLPYGSLLKTGDGAFLGTAFTGGITGVNEFGVVHRLSETGAVTQVAAFQNVVGRWFCSELSEGADGELYGGVAYDLRPFAFNQSTSHAGAFKVSLSGQATGLRSFRNAYYPGTPSRMIQAFGGELYGTYAHGGGPSGNGGGFIFRLTVSGSITQVYQFTSSLGLMAVKHPSGPLTRGPDGELYGTTSSGGTANGGTLFKFDSNYALTVLGSFNQTTGFLPREDLVFSDGYFYGLTAGGGSEFATFYRATPTGEISRITALPWTGNTNCLVLASDGFFYGVTSDGGANNLGSIFRLSKTGELSTFASMDASTGGRPAGVMQARDGYFYGVTYGNGSGTRSIFRADENGAMQALHHFVEETGSRPSSKLMQASDGAFYGTADGGPTGYGVVYRLTVPAIGATGIQKGAEGGMRVSGIGLPSQVHTVKAADHVSQPFVTIGTATADAAGNIIFDDAEAANRERRFYRIIYP